MAENNFEYYIQIALKAISADSVILYREISMCMGIKNTLIVWVTLHGFQCPKESPL